VTYHYNIAFISFGRQLQTHIR